MSDAEPAARRWVVLILACLAQFMLVLDVSVVNVALPDIRTSLDFSEGNLAWVINAYTLAFGGFLLLGGRAADLFGHKRTFLAGIALFTAASLLNALAQTETMLIAGRALQGLGAAFASPAALAVLTTSFTSPTERARALSAWAAVSAGGAAFGLIIGGALVQAFSWEWIFLINVPIGVAVVAAGLRSIPGAERAHGAIDVAGAVAVTAGLVSLVYAIIAAGDHGWGSATTLGFGVLGLSLLGLFLVVEQRAAHPLVRLSIFRQRSLAVGDLVILLLMSGNIAFFFFSSLYLQDTLGYGPLTTGLAFLPITIGIILASGAAQMIVRRIGVRAMAATGLAIAAVAEVWLVALPADATYWTDLLLPFIPMSIGIGLAFVALTMLATSGVKAEEAGLASGVYNTAQQVGGALGLAVIASVAAGASSPMGSFHTAFAASGIMLGAGALLIVALLRPRHVVDVGEVGVGTAVA